MCQLCWRLLIYWDNLRVEFGVGKKNIDNESTLLTFFDPFPIQEYRNSIEKNHMYSPWNPMKISNLWVALFNFIHSENHMDTHYIILLFIAHSAPKLVVFFKKN